MQRAEGQGAEFQPISLRGRVLDRQGRPVSGARVSLVVELEGEALEPDGTVHPYVQRLTRKALTAADGTVRLQLPVHFRGKTTLTVRAADRSLSPVAESRDSTLTVFERPDRRIDGFPVWLGRGGRLDRVLVLIEGFDLYNGFSTSDLLRATGPLSDALRAAGIAILAVDFPDSHLPPDQLAPQVARAIRAASQLVGGKKVAVATLSAGGIVARWALCEAENAGQPLSVHTLLLADCPNRGANVPPSLQALILRYGKPRDRGALQCEAARVLLTRHLSDPNTQVRWRMVGPPFARRTVPVETNPDTTASARFYARLRALNDHQGYPKQCRTIAVANGSRKGAGGGEGLMRLWLPYNHFWNEHTQPQDRVPGSLLPALFAAQFEQIFFLGLGGSYLRSRPTFLPTASALDAEADETPPFDAWFALPDNAAPCGHDSLDPRAGAFVVKELLSASWE